MLFQYDAVTEPVSTSPETVTADRWQGSAPALLPRRKALTAALVATALVTLPLFVPSAAAAPDKWDPVAGAPIRQRPRVPGVGGAVDPLFVAPVVPVVDRWDPVLGVPVRQPRRVPGVGGAVDPVFVAPAAPAQVLGWEGSQAVPARRPAARQQGGTTLPPAVDAPAETVTVDKWFAPASVPVRQARRGQPALEPWGLTQPEPAVPVDFWQGVAPHLLVRQRRVADTPFLFAPPDWSAEVAPPVEPPWRTRFRIGRYRVIPRR